MLLINLLFPLCLGPQIQHPLDAVFMLGWSLKHTAQVIRHLLCSV